MYLAGHVPAKKQVSHSHRGPMGEPCSRHIPSVSAVRKHGMPMPTVREAGVNRVVTQWPLAACLEAGSRVTTGTQTWFQGMAIWMAFSKWSYGAPHLTAKTPHLSFSSHIQRPAFCFWTIFQALVSGTKIPRLLTKACSCLPPIIPEQTSGAHYLSEL